MKLSTTLGSLLLAASLGLNAYLYWTSRHPVVITSEPAMEVIVMRTEGGLLEVATVRTTETFDTSREETILGIRVGKTMARIRVLAVFRYHIPLAKEWKFLVKDKTFIVIAPPVKPSLPVAIDTGRLEAQSSGTWSILTGASLVQELQRAITQTLAVKAESAPYVQLQREAARETVREFVKKWVVSQDRWKSQSGLPIRVYFADEPIQSLRSEPQPFGGQL